MRLLDEAITRRPPATACCGFWPLQKGVRWALIILVVESSVQLLLSFLRPSALWVATTYVFVCFLIQDLTRLFLLAVSLFTLRAFTRRRRVVHALSLLVHALLWLALLELIEMLLKLGVEAEICKRDLGNRGDSSVIACELISDMSEMVVSIVTVLPPYFNACHLFAFSC